jgi:DNA-binding CsgD family transcriptional regulator
MRVSSPAFVGRRSELDRLTAILDGQPATLPAVTLVAGEAGVGKTRFINEVAGHARGRGFRVLTGGCVQLGGEGLPFGPIIEALRGLAEELPAAELEGLAGSGRAEVARLMPGLAPAVERRSTLDADPSGQARLFEHLLQFLDRLAGRGPITFVIEDLHWTDRSTLELLAFLIHNLRNIPILVLITYRSDELHRQHPLVPFLAGLERSGQALRLDLDRFARAEVGDQVENILGTRPDLELVDEIYARSDGNPFFAEELLAAGAARSRLPETLREVLIERAATLSEPSQELMRMASAAGASINASLLATVTGKTEAELSGALREAVARQILVPSAGGKEERYAFRHALVQEAVYSDLLPGERTRLHAAFAASIDLDADGTLDATRMAELAHHWQAANELPRALSAWIHAGIAAQELYAVAEAQAYFERALGLWDHVADAAAHAPVDKLELLVRAGAAAEARSGARSVAHMKTAIGLVDATTDPTRAGLVHERLAEYALNLSNFSESLAEYREAVRLIPTDPPSPARALALAGLGRALTYVRLYTDAIATCEDAIGVARVTGARSVESKALVFLGTSLRRTGDVSRGMAELRRAVGVAEEAGDAFAVGHAMAWLAMGLVRTSKFEDAVEVGLEAEAFAVQHGVATRWAGAHLSHAARALTALGRWDEATAVLERAWRYSPSINDEDISECFVPLEALRGHFASAARHAARLRPVSLNLGNFKVEGLAEMALWQGDPLAARQAIRDAFAKLDTLLAVQVEEVGWSALGLRAEADLAAQARAVGSEVDLEEARRNGAALLGRMRAYAAEVAAERPYYTPQADAFLASCEAEWSRLEGPSDPDLWKNAAAAWAALRMPYPKAYALMREAQALLAGRRDRGRLAPVLTEAFAIADRLGAQPLRTKVEDLALRAGVRLTDDTPTASANARRQKRGSIERGRDELTRREVEVVGLLAAGRSDGEMAAQLFISKKTVSVHVANIKAKLGAESRREVVTGAIRRGLVRAAKRD